jgi:hypothetical protein
MVGGEASPHEKQPVPLLPVPKPLLEPPPEPSTLPKPASEPPLGPNPAFGDPFSPLHPPVEQTPAIHAELTAVRTAFRKPAMRHLGVLGEENASHSLEDSNPRCYADRLRLA